MAHQIHQTEPALLFAERVAQRDDQTDPRCPACHAAATAPIRSEYRGRGRIQHHWHCHACGHEWLSSIRVLD